MFEGREMGRQMNTDEALAVLSDLIGRAAWEGLVITPEEQQAFEVLCGGLRAELAEEVPA